MHKRYLTILTFLLAIKALLLVFAILYAGIGLGPDEAQYWTWSRHLDWGYYSKPPGISWEIALGTFFFGQTELGVRFMPLVIGFLLPYVVYLMAVRCCLKPIACFWAAVCMAFCPIGILASFLAITDGGMVFFWAITCAYLAGKIETRTPPNYFFVGLLVLCGALFKWPIYSLWLVVLVSWIFFPSLRSWRILGGMGISLLALFPSLYWNATHEWATFRHVLATLAGGHAKPQEGAITSGNLLEFLGAQAVLISPVLFVLLVLAWKQLVSRKNHLPHGILFCGGVSFVVVAIGTILAFFMKIQGNWAIFAYPSAFILLSWYVFDGTSWKKKALVAGVVFSAVVCAAVFSIPSIQSHSPMTSTLQVPYKISPFRHNVGWDELAPVLKAAGYEEGKDFLFGDKYQTASILSFYGPSQQRAYFFNLQGSRKNQFSFWPGMPEEQKEKKGFFVVIENIPHLNNALLPEQHLKALEPYFQSVRFLGIKPLFQSYGKTVKGVLLFECEGYQGLTPSETDLY